MEHVNKMKNYKVIPINKSSRQCGVYNCYSKCTQNISIHRFPKNAAMKKKWALAINMSKLILKESFVCSLHFVKSDFVPISGTEPEFKVINRLKKGAIPSRNIPEVDQETTIVEVIKTEKENQDEESLNSKCDTDLAKRSIIDYLNTDTQLKEFCGIPNLKLLYEIVEGVKSILLQKNFSNESLSVTHRILLTFVKIKLDFSLICLSALFQINEETCRYYLNETIEFLTYLLYYTVENCPENGDMIKILMQVNKIKECDTLFS